MAPIWSILPVKGNLLYKALWIKVAFLMRLGTHVNVTFRLARFWYILVTLVTYRHLVLLPLRLSLWFSPVFFLLTPSLIRSVAMEAAEELWPGLPSGVFQKPHCSLGPSSCDQMGGGLCF